MTGVATPAAGTVSATGGGTATDALASDAELMCVNAAIVPAVSTIAANKTTRAYHMASAYLQRLDQLPHRGALGRITSRRDPKGRSGGRTTGTQPIEERRDIPATRPVQVDGDRIVDESGEIAGIDAHRRQHELRQRPELRRPGGVGR